MSTTIQWTEDTWNPITGCSVVSPGCTNCYAMRRMAPRLWKNPATPQYHGTVQPSKGGYVWTGKIGIAAHTAFRKPLRTRKPTMFFVNSMSDLFHENVPDEVIDRIFAVMALCPQHTFQVLTKRSARMRKYMTAAQAPARLSEIIRESGYAAGMTGIHVEACADAVHFEGKTGEYPLLNVWLGVSVEDQTRANERIPDLLATPAAIRFISAEPLLGPVDLTPHFWGRKNPCGYCPQDVDCECGFKMRWEFDDEATVDWVIVGGESGKGARPMNPQWAREIRDQCAAAAVPYFHKQNGEWLSVSECEGDYPIHKFDDHRCVRRIGTKAAGRLLDGVEHNAMPELS